MTARVAIVTPTLRRIGGTEIYLERLRRVQRELGYTVRVFTQDNPDTSPRDPDVIHCGQTLSESLAGALAKTSESRRLADELAEHDWVEFHRLAPPALVRRLQGRVPTLLFQHTQELTCPALGRWLPRSQSTCGRAPGAGCLGVDAFQGCMVGMPPRQRLRAFTRGPVSRMLARSATAMIFNSEANRDLFARTIGEPPRAFVLPPPHGAPGYAPARRVANRLLFVGRMDPVKGATHAVRAAALAARTLPDIELHLYGDGPERIAAEKLATDLKVNAVFRGWADAAAVAEGMREAACLLLPSLWFEAWGMTGPEAIAAGCPVVAYDVGGVREWLLPAFGEVVPPGYPDAMAEAALRQLAESPDSRGDIAAEARDRWGMEAFKKAYQAVVRAALAPSSPSAAGHEPVMRPDTIPRRIAALPAFSVTAARRTLAATAQAVLFRPPRGSEARVAVYRIGSMGDQTCALPALEAIRRRHPDARVTLISERVEGEPWARRLGYADALRLELLDYATPAELRAAVRSANPECLYYLAPQPLTLRRALRDALFFRLTGARRAAGFGAVDPTMAAARAMRPWKQSEPEARRLLRACRLKRAETALSPDVYPLPPHAIVFAPAGKTPTQRWPESRYIELARMAAHAGYQPVWVGDATDGERLERAGEPPGLNLTGRLTPLELHGALAGACAVVANDTGIAHLAALHGTPLLVIASARTFCGSWEPSGDGPIRVRRVSMNCEGCYHAECEDVRCLDLVTTLDAWRRLSRLLD